MGGELVMMVLFEQTRKLLHSLTEVVCYFQNQENVKAKKMLKKVVDMLQIYIESLDEVNLKNVAVQLSAVCQAIKEGMGLRKEQWVIMHIQRELMPILFEIQENVFGQSDEILKDCWGKNRLYIRKKNRDLYRDVLSARDNISDEYQLSWAKTGDLVLSVHTAQGMVRLNSAGNPWQEAFLFVLGERQVDFQECVVVGFGMGYHIEALAKQPGIERIIVLENDLAQLAITFSYRDLSEILSDERVSILYCPDSKDYVKWLNEESDRQCFIWQPSIKTIREKSFREAMEDYWIESSSVKTLGGMLEKNFRENIGKGDMEVSCLKEVFYKKSILFVAAGPSLEIFFKELEALDRTQFILVCVGKVARKLIQAEVYPDYIVMTDGLPGTVWQIRGIEDCGIPLIYLSTVATDVVDSYQGKRYIAFQEGFPLAEEFAAENKLSLYQSGGSVATFAIDMGIRMGVERIVCLGLDMGYIDERSHAFGIGASVTGHGNLRKVEGIVSKYIYTSKTLDIYRRWIEKRIQGEKGTEFINVSKGARIYGMKEKELKECFAC